MDRSGGIGKDNQVPWHLSDDLRRFKRLTMDHHLIMGRKTHQSIGRPLPGRTNVVLSHNPNFKVQGGLTANSLEEALTLVEERGENEVFIIGGGEIFEQSISIADRIYLTRVDALVDCDVFFPKINQSEWVVTMTISHTADHRNQHSFVFNILENSLT